MNKIIKTILIVSLTVIGTGFLAVPSTFANDNLVVEFEQTPLFNEANFLPGEEVARWVKVTNNSGQSQRIAVEAVEVRDPDRLGDVLNLQIKYGASACYIGPLSKFFNDGEASLSNFCPELSNNSTATYDFLISFYPATGNSFQGKSLNFDIIIGFQGTEGGILPGAGGGYLPPGLTISNQSDPIATDNSALITWNTSYPATSQVIYARESEKHTLDLTDNIGTPPKYGYERTTLEFDTSPKATLHKITITDLAPNTKYYYRAVSHASPPTISRNYSFTTFGKNEEAAQANKAANEASRENQTAFNQSAENISEENDDNFSDFSLILNKLFTIIIGGAMLAGLLYFGYRTKNKKN